MTSPIDGGGLYPHPHYRLTPTGILDDLEGEIAKIASLQQVMLLVYCKDLQNILINYLSSKILRVVLGYIIVE